MKLRNLLAIAALLACACRPAFNPAVFADADALYAGAITEFEAERFDNAALAFDRLTTILSTRDPRLAQVYFYLARSQERSGDNLLAAKSFSRVYELFPQDTLADDALFQSGMAYQAMWRRPTLDAQHGEDAITQFQTLQALYPDSPLLPQATEQLTRLDEWFAIKDYEIGYHYLRRKAYDSAIIYFRDVIRLHPNARKTRDAYLRLHEAYRAINYREDARELCEAMLAAYPADSEVRRACGSVTTAAGD